MITTTCAKPQYKTVSTRLTNEDGAPVTTYGLACVLETPSGCELQETVYDISLNPQVVELMAKIFTRCGLPPHRLRATVLLLIS